MAVARPEFEPREEGERARAGRRQWTARVCPWCQKLRWMRRGQRCCSFACARYTDGIRMPDRAKHARAVHAGRASGTARRAAAWARVAQRSKTEIWKVAYEMGYKHGWMVGRRMRRMAEEGAHEAQEKS